MKKTLLTLCLAAASFTTFAQVYEDETPTTFGIKAGLNQASIKTDLSGFSVPGQVSSSTKSLTSFHIGFFADIKFTKELSLQPALLYTGKGGSFAYAVNIEAEGFNLATVATEKLSLYYLQLPVNLVYTMPVGDNHLFFGAGPYIAVGLSGRQKGSATIIAEGMSETTSFDQKVIFGNNPEESTVRSTDYGATALVGFKFWTGFSVNASYDFGLCNIQPYNSSQAQQQDADINISPKTRTLSLSVGYTF
ncbi:hypothetical protein GCM10023149_51830 [Mucilaginibacter gynuensis]|uniref:Outer membrane protein beta-barrel domain-containing protein n=1 Tax=Mucilaginibacter gynuensis TaxID=1302236 RepID=A0ABP8HKF4_9SPHI